jgi:hypothetical protein
MKPLIRMSALTIASTLCLASAVQADATTLDSTNTRNQPNTVIVHTGADALRMELQVLAQVITDTTTQVVNGNAKSAELSPLLERRAALQKSLESPTPSAMSQTETLTGCGQTVNLAALISGNTAGSQFSSARATVTVDSLSPALIEGVLYTIVKENGTNQRKANYQTFRYNSQKILSGTYFSSSFNQTTNGLFGAACGKAFAQAVISNGSGNPLTCNLVPVLVEASAPSSVGNDCDSGN